MIITQKILNKKLMNNKTIKELENKVKQLTKLLEVQNEEAIEILTEKAIIFNRLHQFLKKLPMRTGIYKGKQVKVYDNGFEYIVEFWNGTSITLTDTSEITFTD